MRPPTIALDFIPQRRRPGLLGWALLALGLIMTGLEVDQYLTRQDDLIEREQIVERLRHQLTRERAPVVAAATAGEVPVSAEEATPALALAHELGRDWSGLFAQVAAAGGADVALMAFVPDARRGQVQVQASTARLRALFDYMQRLEDTGVLHGVELVAYERRQGRFVFSLSARWGAA